MKNILKRQTITLFKPAPDAPPLQIPFIDEGVKAGFPSPAQDYVEQRIDLNKVLIKHPSSTFFAKVDGDSMENTFIMDKDIVIIDKSLEVKEGCKVVAFIDGDFVMKTIKLGKNEVYLIPENPEYPTITVTADNQFTIWGVVTYVIHKLY